MKGEIDNNSKVEKRNLHSLNNNNGSGKSFLLKMIPHIEHAHIHKSGIFFSQAVTLPPAPTAESLFIAILNSIKLSFNLYNANIILPNAKDNYNAKIINILSDLSKYISDINNEKTKENAWKRIISNYNINDENQKKYTSRPYKTYCFLFDEIGEIKLMDKNLEINPKHNIFNEESKIRIRKMEELRQLLNDYLLKHKNLDAILAGKEGLAPFMGNSSRSVQIINHFNLPPLGEEYLPTILKFELTKKNSKFRDLLRKEFEFNNKNEANLDKFLDALLEKVFLYTGGHPRILTYTLMRLLKIGKMEEIIDTPSNKNHKDVYDKIIKSNSCFNDLMNNQGDKKYSEFLDFLLESLMIKIKPEDFNSLLERFNDELLYNLFDSEIKGLDDIEKSYKVIAYLYFMLQSSEMKFNIDAMNYVLNKFIKEKTYKLNKNSHIIKVDSEQFLNAIGLPYKKVEEKVVVEDKVVEEKNIILYFPKYVSDSLEEILAETNLPVDYIMTYIFHKYRFDKEKFEEVASIYLYAKSLLDNDQSNKLHNFIPLGIKGKSQKDGYIKEIFNQLSLIPATLKTLGYFNLGKHIVLFGLNNSYAFDGIVLINENEKLTMSFIQVKSTRDKSQISTIAKEISTNIVVILNQIKEELKTNKHLHFLEKDYSVEMIKEEFVVSNPSMAEDIVRQITNKLANTNADNPEVIAFDYEEELSKISIRKSGLFIDICEIVSIKNK